MQYWYNVDTGVVETDDTRSQNATVMGPYESQDAASRALDSARQRTEAWDAEDAAWESGQTED